MHPFAGYLAEAFGEDVPVWEGDVDLTVVRSAMESAPAGLLLGCIPDSAGLNVAFRGSGITVLENHHRPARVAAPADFRVVALMPTYNEADIVRSTLQYLVAQGIEVYAIDNWSTDGTFEIAREFLGRGLIGLERFPADGPLELYEWRSILRRIESVAEEIAGADWFIFHDVDERRRSPWRELDLKSAIYYADRCGFTCIDHIVLNFHPTDNRFDAGFDVEDQFRYFAFSDHEGHFHQRKAWKNPRCRVELASTAGHDIRFSGRLVYPYKFLLKHYPIRSQAHGERKVFRDRAKRWSAEERALGWHKQYDDVPTAASFLRDPASLLRFDQATFYEQYLVERLSGIGIFQQAPWWSTGPRYNCADER
ncbi:MAG TPA: glycosyltransferase [Bryobacteraceae bacterium]|nr:glycosyltransferase [Bryobacteraceae bacterium]